MRNATTDTLTPFVRVHLSRQQASQELAQANDFDMRETLQIKTLDMADVWFGMLHPNHGVPESQPKYANGTLLEDGFPSIQYILQPSTLDAMFAKTRLDLEVQRNVPPVFFIPDLRLLVSVPPEEGSEDEQPVAYQVFPIYLHIAELLHVCMKISSSSEPGALAKEIQAVHLSSVVQDLRRGASAVANFRSSALMQNVEDEYQVCLHSVGAASVTNIPPSPPGADWTRIPEEGEGEAVMP